jgi:hypothetical protein
MICNDCTQIIIRVIKARRMRWAGQVARVGKLWCVQDFCRHLEGTRPLGKPKHRREGNIKMGLQEMG